jgi:hypothetical protein
MTYEVSAHLTKLAQLVSIIAIDLSGSRKTFRLSLTHSVRARLSKKVDVPFFVDFSDTLGK